MTNTLSKYLFLWAVGGAIYYSFELIFRGFSHWTMFLLGGICFVLCGAINQTDRTVTLGQQMLISTLLITELEFFFGLVLNLWLGLNIWDYSHLPFNLLGQICLPFSLLWALFSIGIIWLDDHLRCWFYGESLPVNPRG